MRRISIIAFACISFSVSCLQERAATRPAAVYTSDIQQLLQTHCASCHGSDDDAGAGFRVDTYLDTIGCPTTQPDVSALRVQDSSAPILDVLSRPDHAGLLSAAQVDRLRGWVLAGAPLRATGVHAGGILNPHSSEWHGRLAAPDHYGSITQADHPDACGRCHAGAPVTPKGVQLPAPGAPACTSCHREPEGVLACGTCHGDGAARAYPPRDACQFPGQRAGAHRAHVTSTRLRSTPLTCVTCHSAADATLSGTHADGKVDVVFDPALAGDDASYDASTGQCTVRCHNQGGARATPVFSESGPLGCGDCHQSPPVDHYAGACNTCHGDVDATGTVLVDSSLHVNGHVDFGNGSGDCSACHGQNGDPTPLTASHVLHRGSALSRAITCDQCHVVPSSVTSDGHLARDRTTATVTFGTLASARDRTPIYAARSCLDVACHGAGLPGSIEQAWTWDGPSETNCNRCHATPPAAPHPADAHCSSLTCHGSEISSGAPLQITESGRALHIDGNVDTTQR